MTDKSDKTDPDGSHTALVEALESIKGLLEQGEEKLSIARESIKRANASSRPISPIRKILQTAIDEEIVPVLDDIVEPDELDFEIPVLSKSPPEPEPKSKPIPKSKSKSKRKSKSKSKSKSKKAATKTEKIMKTSLDEELIDSIQKDLEQVVREHLMKTMIKLENELKLEIKKQLDKLRDS